MDLLSPARRAAVATVACLLLAACTSAPEPTAPSATTSSSAAPAPTTSSPSPQDRVAELSAAGPYATRTASYELPGLRLPGAAYDVEVVGQVVGPVGATGALPVVVLLHGFAAACYTPGGNGGAATWPCPKGQKAIPSHLGFTYAQERLASHGFLTVSIAANGVNVLNEEVGKDAGARERSLLVRHHLDRLAAGDVPALAEWPDADLSRVLLVGHSRGGEGVDRAAYERPDSAAWDVRGVVLVGATAFDPVPRSRTAVVNMSGDCDGDVGPSIGQLYVDRAAESSSLLRTSVLIGGANHNFFNTEWDPATSVSGIGGDDVVGDGQDAGPRCSPKSPTRLTSDEQKESLARGLTLVSAALLADDPAATAVLDGRSAFPAVASLPVWVTATGGGRTTVVPGTGLAATASGASKVRACKGLSSQEDKPALCGSGSVQGLSPHWTDEGEPWKARDALELRWTAPGGAVALALAQPLDLSTSSAVELRVPIDDAGSPVTLELALTDAAGATAVVGSWGPVDAMRGDQSLPSRRWGQSMLLPLDGVAGVDLSRITTVTVTPSSPSGRVWILDVSAVPR